jgi:acyl-CoA synthetase (AMP-forming)/AMP-acid ligase II
VSEDGILTYGEAALIAAGLRACAPVIGSGCCCPTGCYDVGLSVVPLNTWLRPGELAAVARRADLRAVIVDGDAPSQGADELGTFASDGARSFVGTFTWSREEALPTGDPPSLATDEYAKALVLFTSGSSAEPKAVPLTQAGLVTKRTVGRFVHQNEPHCGLLSATCSCAPPRDPNAHPPGCRTARPTRPDNRGRSR